MCFPSSLLCGENSNGLHKPELSPSNLPLCVVAVNITMHAGILLILREHVTNLCDFGGRNKSIRPITYQRLYICSTFAQHNCRL